MANTSTTAKQQASATTIAGTFPRIIALTALSVTAISALSVTLYSMSAHKTRLAERTAQVAELVAPDLAWRETDRLQHIFDSELNGHALALDTNARVLAGDETLLSAPRTPVVYDGKQVGFISAPGAVAFEFLLPYWLLLGCGFASIFVSVAMARHLSSRISNSVEELADYAEGFGTQIDAIEIPQGEFQELTNLRLAMESASQRTIIQASRLRGAAYSDQMTGLPNQTYLREVLPDKVNSMSIEKPGAFLLLDLDGFVTASDSLGLNGDKKILDVAIKKIAAVLDDFGTADARPILMCFQSDNFGLLVPSCPHGRESAASIARRLNIAFETPLAVADRFLKLGISAGITMLPEDGNTLDEIHRRAGMALREARKTARNHYEFYAPRLDRIAKGRYQLEAELRTASVNCEFVPVFQPKINFATGQIVGAEALARWQQDGGKIVMPGTFIGVAEEIGLIEEIGRQILDASCRAAAEWSRKGYDIPVAVNVSPAQFEQENFGKIVLRSLEDAGLPPHMLELEITESMAVQDPEMVAEVMRPLREIGVGFAIDDFGTGHSNLSMLTQLPFNVFKIDRQFVSALQNDPQAPAIVEMILAMAETLGLKTVAEGVETIQQAEFLRRRGCTLGQGFLYSPGVPQAKFLEMLSDFQSFNRAPQLQSRG